MRADESFAGELGRKAPGVWVVGGDAADGVGEVHVDFEEELGEAEEGLGGEVGLGADGEGALVVGGEIEEEPEVLGEGVSINREGFVSRCQCGLTFRASSVPAGQRWPKLASLMRISVQTPWR